MCYGTGGLLTLYAAVAVDGDYDDAVAAVMNKTQSDKNSLMVMDISFEGYEDVQKVGAHLSALFYSLLCN